MQIDTEHYTRARAIETFQIEPSMGCQLECPGCIPKSDRRSRIKKTNVGHMTLRPDVLYKIVRDFNEAGISVKKFDMQGHGEPILHDKVWEMMGFISKTYPGSINSICTHANGTFEPSMVTCGVNEILFAIDGVDQASYAPYRVLGSFDKAWRFMSEFSLRAASDAPQVDRVWKYVLFEHNDKDEQLLRAQELALEAKITNLRFVLTQLGPVSSRINVATDIPILDPALKITIDSYRIDYSQLEAALRSLRTGLDQNDNAASAQWAGFFSNSVHRLFKSTARIPTKYKALIEQYDDLVAKQPAEHMGPHTLYRGKLPVPRKPHLQWNNEANAKVYRAGSNSSLVPPRAQDVDVGTFKELIDRVEVDEAWYLTTYPELSTELLNGKIDSMAQHYADFGYLEQRLPYRPVVDEGWYRRTYPDVQAAIDEGTVANATEHFVHHGYREGRHRDSSTYSLPPLVQPPQPSANEFDALFDASTSVWFTNESIGQAIARRTNPGAKHWLYWLFQERLPRRPRRLLSIGCGDGDHELIIAREGFANTIDAFDGSAKRIAKAQASAQAEGLDINFVTKDFERWIGEESHVQYDAVMFVASLHHVSNLESMLAKVRRLLSDNGVVIYNEYVGPNYMIFPDNQVEIINGMLAAVPTRFKRRSEAQWCNPDIDTMLRIDPSESPRSSLIPQMLRLYFDVIWEADLGGGLLHPIFKLLDGAALNDGSAESRTTLDFLVATETVLMQQGVLRSDFVLGLAEKKKRRVV